MFGLFEKKDNRDTPMVVTDYTNKDQLVKEEVGGDENKMDGEMKEEKSNENNYGEDYDDDPKLFDPQEVDKSKLSVPYKKIFGKKTTKETKQLTKDFIEIFYNLDGRYPNKFIKKSKEFMTPDLYETLLEDPEAPTYNVFNRKYISLEIIESKKFTKKDAEENIIPYIVYIKGETVNAEKQDKKEVTDVYTILLIKKDDQYKVNHIYPNINFQ
ncbi:hypothetical protein WMZ97_16590 [Lentibacillus sp. N15]|uniref:hypothetical protein n=1 Tax=Lentibacillus songyuanensis TaxID=3136161 RepID=UPI0031BA5E3F